MLRRTLAVAVCALIAPLIAPRVACGLETIYLANDDHTDYFWSGDGTQYRTAFLEMLDYYMDQAEATATNPPDQRGRFNTDGSLWIWEYEKNRSAAEFDRLISHLGAGTITMPKNTAIILYGAMPTEAVLRDMYYAGRLERAHGLSFPTVYPMENQVLQGGLASLWAGSGVLYSWKGICDCATLINAADRPREIYRFEGPDGQGITLKWNSALNGNQSIGGYAEARDPFGIVNYCETNAAYNARWVWPRHGAFGYGWDDLSSTTNLFVQAAQQLSNANRRVVVSNQVDFFEDFLTHHATEIPTFGGSFGNEWELLCAAMADVTAGVKRRVETLRTAESLKTLVDLHDPNLLAGREAERDLAFLAMGLFYEHCWGGDGVVPQNVRIQFQRDQAARIALYVDDLLADALLALGGLVAQSGGTERHVVWNPLSFARTEAVDLAITTPGTVHAVDLTSGLEVPSQTVTVNGQPRLRILASNVPSVGYRVYEVRPGAGQSFPPSAAVTLPSFDNGIYRVTLGARGQITSVLDHQDGDRELVEAGGALHDLGNGAGSVVVESAGPVTTTLLVNAGGSPPHQTRVTLTAGLDQIAIEGRITANFNTNVGYLSRFNLAGMTMRHEEVGMIATVSRAAAGGDYADQNARTDFLTMNHFVDLSTATRGVTLSNWDGAFFQAGNSTVTTLDATTPSLRAMVGFRVGGYGIPNQGGDSSFLNRYALTAHGAYDQAAAMRFALSHQNPLVATRVTGGSGAPLPENEYTLVTLDSDDVLLWSLKPSEEGIESGLIARVWNLAEGTRSMALSLPPYSLASASAATHVETDVAPVALNGGVLEATLSRQELRTYRLMPAVATSVDLGGSGPAVWLQVAANPIRRGADAEIRFALSSAGQASLEVVDVGGAIVRRIDLGNRGVGEGGTRVSFAGMSAGVYFLRLTSRTATVTTKVNVVG